jgi:hypothetical protein
MCVRRPVHIFPSDSCSPEQVGLFLICSDCSFAYVGDTRYVRMLASWEVLCSLSTKSLPPVSPLKRGRFDHRLSLPNLLLKERSLNERINEYDAALSVFSIHKFGFVS